VRLFSLEKRRVQSSARPFSLEKRPVQTVRAPLQLKRRQVQLSARLFSLEKHRAQSSARLFSLEKRPVQTVRAPLQSKRRHVQLSARLFSLARCHVRLSARLFSLEKRPIQSFSSRFSLKMPLYLWSERRFPSRRWLCPFRHRPDLSDAPLRCPETVRSGAGPSLLTLNRKGRDSIARWPERAGVARVRDTIAIVRDTWQRARSPQKTRPNAWYVD